MAHPTTVRQAREIVQALNAPSYPTSLKELGFTKSQINYRLQIANELGLVTKVWEPFRKYQRREN